MSSCEKSDDRTETKLRPPVIISNPADIIPRKFIWSIGIFQGSSPFHFQNYLSDRNPVLKAEDVTDIKAKFVADPFVIEEDGMYYMYFEVMNERTFKGDIGYATSIDGVHWIYQKIVLTESFHLSYPCVFKENDWYYMIPETHLDSSVRLYKATHFPDVWEYIGNLIEGRDFVDPTIVFFNNKWWIFVSPASSNILYLYYSDKIKGVWKEHPRSPIVAGDSHYSRPGGRIFMYEGNLVRFAQDDAPYYGISIWALKVTHLNESEYEEEIVSYNPVVTWGTEWWNLHGMHQVDIFMQKDGYYFAAVDGYY
jgi:hypothetical protein